MHPCIWSGSCPQGLHHFTGLSKMFGLGAFTGGLNVLDEAFTKVFPEGLTAFALGEGKVFVLSGGSLLGDVPRGAPWKL